MNATLLGPLISAASALVVVLIGAVAVPIVRERRALNLDARYLAIRIVCILDRYVEDCASAAIDSGEEDKEGVSTPRVEAPPAPVYPSDVNWKSIEHSMMYKLLSLPASADRAANYVDGSWENASPPDYSEFFEARSQQYSLLGLQAHALTVTLRKQYGITPVDDRAWDPVRHMKDQLKQIAALQEQRHAAWEENLPPAIPPASKDPA
jgi:hypothetical protein